MSCEDPVKLAEKKASEYEMVYHGCAQATLLALIEALNLPRDSAFRASTGLSGGMGLLGYVCGAFSGAVMAIGARFGRDFEDFFQHDPAGKRLIVYRLVREYHKRFVEELGSCICKEIQERKYGRSFDLTDPKEYEEFVKAGAHSPSGCPEVCGKAARIAAELILEAEKR
ncbi:MAG: hypothetical protein DRN61_04145 [Thaumarchaeota archaeon]|nr:MAG: hypothetical protein DRN61_04145 [Nitrososphaerota archaeon]